MNTIEWMNLADAAGAWWGLNATVCESMRSGTRAEAGRTTLCERGTPTPESAEGPTRTADRRGATPYGERKGGGSATGPVELGGEVYE